METAFRHPASGNEPHSRGRERNRSAVGRSSDESVQASAALRIAGILNRIIFFSLLTLMFLSAVPYGTVEPWWKAVFVCVVFVLWIFGVIESLLCPPRENPDRQLLMPLFGLIGLALIQSLPLGVRSNPATPYQTWSAISADPYQTQFFAVQLLAITFAGALLARFTSTDRRVSILLHVILAVAVCSAVFGVLRQTNQHTVGFGLPLLVPGLGYGQFINPSHFALLMEMAFGLTLGMILAAGKKREWILVYGAVLVIVWTALVLANSRGGLLAMVAQIVVAGLLFTVVVPASKAEGYRSRIQAALRSLPARILLLIVLLAGVITGTLWIGGDRLAGRFDDSSGGVSSADARTGGSRNEIWRATWQAFKANPITGVGLGGYWAAIPVYHDASGSLTPQEAHNEYLELLASGGIIGGALGCWFLIALGKRIATNLRSSNPFRRASRYGAVLGIVGVAVHSLFDFGLHMLVNALIFAALVVIATRRGQSEHKLRRSDA